MEYVFFAIFGVLVLFIGVPAALIYFGSAIRPVAGGAISPTSNRLTWMMVGVTIVFLSIITYLYHPLIALGILCVVGFVWMMWKKVGGATLPVLIGLGCVGIWLFGPENVLTGARQVGASFSGAEAPAPPALSAVEQEARLERLRQDEQVAAQRAELAARQAALVADERAKAAAIEERTRAIADSLPDSVFVPHCDTGTWSQVVTVPLGWHVRSDWGARSLTTQYLNPAGNWTKLEGLNAPESVTAFRYCTLSAANVQLREMGLTWSSF